MFKLAKTTAILFLSITTCALAKTFDGEVILEKDLNLTYSNYSASEATIIGNNYAITTNDEKTGLKLNQNSTILTVKDLGSYSVSAATASDNPLNVVKKFVNGKIQNLALKLNHNGANNFTGQNGAFIGTDGNAGNKVQLSVENSVVHNNENVKNTTSSPAQGGAINIMSNKKGDDETAEEAQTHSVTISNSWFNENKVQNLGGAQGGAINTQLNHGNLEIIDSFFTNNSAIASEGSTSTGIKGGAISNLSAKLNVIDSYFGKNKVQGYSVSGGAIYDDIASYTSTPTAKEAFETHKFTNVIFEQNSANSEGGGASGGAMASMVAQNIENALFKDNSVTVSNASKGNALGGALYQSGKRYETKEEGKPLEPIFAIKNTTFEGNSIELNNSLASSGGALHQKGTNASTDDIAFTLDNVAFNNNSITSTDGESARGGALTQSGEKINSTITNTSFEGNSIKSQADFTKAKYHNDGWDEWYDVIESVGGAFYFEGTPSSASASASNQKLSRLTLDNVSFKNNSIESNNYSAGGALAISDHTGYPTTAVVNINNTVFQNNSATSTATAQEATDGVGAENQPEYLGAAGGAIYNGRYNVLNVTNSTFEGNSSHSSSTEDKKLYGGGAVYNQEYGIATFTDTNFTNNTATGTAASGGAIYNAYAGTTNIVAMNKDVVFEGNKAGDDANNLSSNAYYGENLAVLNLNAAKDKKIVFNDSISSQTPETKYGRLYTSKININNEGKNTTSDSAYNTSEKLPDWVPSGENAGTVVLNANMDDFKGDVTMHGGTLQLGQNGTFFNGANSFSIMAPSALDTANGVIQEHNLGNFTLNAPLKLSLDANLENSTMDKFNIDTLTKNDDAQINIQKINVMADAKAEVLDLSMEKISDNQDFIDLLSLDESAKTALGKVYKYDVELDEENNSMSFTRKGLNPSGGGNTPITYNDINPAVMVGPVAAQAAYMSQLNSYDQAFQNTVSTMMQPRLFRSMAMMDNRYAILEGNKTGGATRLHLEQPGPNDWFRPYTSYEKVNFKDGNKVSNIMYGTYMGTDSRMFELKNGKRAQLSGYIGYNGSHQTFDGNSIYQNGGTLGITGSLYRKNFFSALTIGGGASFATASTMFGNDSFPLISAGIASKSGYNIEFFDGKFVIQPTMLISYTAINAFNYTNAADVKIKSDALNAIQLVPGVRLFANTKNGWQPYASFDFRWNIMDKADFSAADIALPQISIKPYVEYGVGVQKRFKDKISGHIQTLIRNGGRNGIAFSFGLDILLGKKSERL